MGTTKNYAIIVAAGRGRRMGLDVNKQYLNFCGRPVLSHTLNTFDEVSTIDAIIVVITPGDKEYISTEILDKYPLKKRVLLVEGGEERQQSVFNGLRDIQPDSGEEIVVIHDGARPLVTAEMIDKSIQGALRYGAAVVGLPVKDTIKQINEEWFAVATPDRHTLWSVQTPQTFQYDIIMKAHEYARQTGFLATDDGMLVEHMGRPVKMIMGSYHNIKITTPEDLIIAEYLLQADQLASDRMKGNKG